MILIPKACRHNKKLLCGVVKNLGHCPFVDSEHCKDSNATDLFGMVSNAYGTITLKKYRYNHMKVSMSVLTKNMCSECRVIWATPGNCPICKMEE